MKDRNCTLRFPLDHCILWNTLPIKVPYISPQSGGHGGRVVTLSPVTSEIGVRFLAQPQVGKLVVACRWPPVYSTEPWPTVCAGFLCPSNYLSWYDLYSVESNVKPPNKINKSVIHTNHAIIFYFTLLQQLTQSTHLHNLSFFKSTQQPCLLKLYCWTHSDRFSIYPLLKSPYISFQLMLSVSNCNTSFGTP